MHNTPANAFPPNHKHMGKKIKGRLQAKDTPTFIDLGL